MPGRKKTLAVRQNIKAMGIKEVIFHPYSLKDLALKKPEIARSNFFLFKKIKCNLSEGEFGDGVSLGRAIFHCLEDIIQNEFRKTLENWIKRVKSVVECKGDYFHS